MPSVRTTIAAAAGLLLAALWLFTSCQAPQVTPGQVITPTYVSSSPTAPPGDVAVSYLTAKYTYGAASDPTTYTQTLEQFTNVDALTRFPLTGAAWAACLSQRCTATVTSVTVENTDGDLVTVLVTGQVTGTRGTSQVRDVWQLRVRDGRIVAGTGTGVT